MATENTLDYLAERVAHAERVVKHTQEAEETAYEATKAARRRLAEAREEMHGFIDGKIAEARDK